jgi:hypothetical protein
LPADFFFIVVRHFDACPDSEILCHHIQYKSFSQKQNNRPQTENSYFSQRSEALDKCKREYMHETICLRDGENQLKAKTKLIIALVVTTILIVYGIELSIRLVTGASERIEYLVVAVVIIALLLLVDLRLYGNYKKEKTG